MWGIVITWLPSELSYVNFYILIFFSETTGSIGTKLGRNHWMIPNKVFFCCWSKETSTNCVHIYGYKLFIVHLFFMRIFYAFLKKTPFRNMNNIIMELQCITVFDTAIPTLKHTSTYSTCVGYKWTTFINHR